MKGFLEKHYKPKDGWTVETLPVNEQMGLRLVCYKVEYDVNEDSTVFVHCGLSNDRFAFDGFCVTVEDGEEYWVDVDDILWWIDIGLPSNSGALDLMEYKEVEARES